jgi:hypothetical protein
MLGAVHFWPQRGLRLAKTIAEYLEGYCTSSGLNPTGCVTDGYVKLRALVSRATVS